MLHRFPTVTFHSGGVRIFPVAQIEALTCNEATEAIAAISDNFECMKPRGRKSLTLRLTNPNPPKI